MDAQLGLDGSWQTNGYRIYPTWWFEREMGVDGEHTAMYFAAGLRLVLQIPLNKRIAKAVARYAVGSFWRQ